MPFPRIRFLGKNMSEPMRLRRAVAYLTVRGLAFSVTLVHWDTQKHMLIFENESNIWGYRDQLERLLKGATRSVALYKSDVGVKHE
jgi:hypothetical protein